VILVASTGVLGTASHMAGKYQMRKIAWIVLPVFAALLLKQVPKCAAQYGRTVTSLDDFCTVSANFVSVRGETCQPFKLIFLAFLARALAAENTAQHGARWRPFSDLSWRPGRWCTGKLRKLI
jgi:hypothetical protein